SEYLVNINQGKDTRLIACLIPPPGSPKSFNIPNFLLLTGQDQRAASADISCIRGLAVEAVTAIATPVPSLTWALMRFGHEHLMPRVTTSRPRPSECHGALRRAL
ncbi:hypothetical protein D6D01_09090, partial [Aureobasidium pullulans]